MKARLLEQLLHDCKILCKPTFLWVWWELLILLQTISPHHRWCRKLCWSFMPPAGWFHLLQGLPCWLDGVRGSACSSPQVCVSLSMMSSSLGLMEWLPETRNWIDLSKQIHLLCKMSRSWSVTATCRTAFSDVFSDVFIAEMHLIFITKFLFLYTFRLLGPKFDTSSSRRWTSPRAASGACDVSISCRGSARCGNWLLGSQQVESVIQRRSIYFFKDKWQPPVPLLPHALLVYFRF